MLLLHCNFKALLARSFQTRPKQGLKAKYRICVLSSHGNSFEAAGPRPNHAQTSQGSYGKRTKVFLVARMFYSMSVCVLESAKHQKKTPERCLDVLGVGNKGTDFIGIRVEGILISKQACSCPPQVKKAAKETHNWLGPGRPCP